MCNRRTFTGPGSNKSVKIVKIICSYKIIPARGDNNAGLTIVSL